MAVGDIERILAALVDDGVQFVVVGGVAVVLQGYPRLTVDLDLVVALEPDNVRRAMAIFARLGYAPLVPVSGEQFADRDQREAWIRDRGMQVFSLASERFRETRIDLFVREPIPFAELLGDADWLPLRRVTVPTASVEHLLRMKLEAGRDKDLGDIEALRQILRSRGQRNG